MAQPRNIYEQQFHNKKLTAVVMVGFVALFALLGFGYDFFRLGGFQFDQGWQLSSWQSWLKSEFFPWGTTGAIVVGSFSSVWSFYFGSSLVLMSSGATLANRDKPEHRLLLNVVEEMSIASGRPQPKVYMVPDLDLNAFATGRDPDHGVVAVTEGLLKALTREELQGVVAHEMSHIKNYDIRLMTLVSALVGAILLLVDWSLRALRYSSSHGRNRTSSTRSGKGGNPLGLIFFALWIITLILAPFLTQLMAMSVSRKREYLADASAAELTRNPSGLANALEKLHASAAPTRSINRGFAHLCIVDPLERKLNTKEGFFAEIFGTHPPIQKRIQILKSMAYSK